MALTKVQNHVLLLIKCNMTQKIPCILQLDLCSELLNAPVPGVFSLHISGSGNWVDSALNSLS